MSGAPNSFPPGEAPAAEAREEAALARDLAPDSTPLDITRDEPPAEPARVARGAEAIREFWRHAPLGPGVYRMIGSEGEVLYVGKARSIKKRIAAYMAPERQPSRIARMVAQTHSMVFVTTASDAEALLLEANLIKQLKPRYNVTLRDDKSFPYILICTGHAAPRLIKHRGARSLTGDYFGPFASAGAVFRTLNALQRAFLLRTCSDSFYANRTRPCLLHQIKRCSAPCTGEIGLDDYANLVTEARDFLSGRSRAIKSRLGHAMNEAAAALDFESAARLRDRISALSAIQGEQSVNPRSIAEADVFAVTDEAGQFCVEVFFFRTYQNWGNRAYFPRADRALSREEVLDAFLAQFYLDRPAPRLVLLSHDVPSAGTLAEVLSARVGHRIAIGAPVVAGPEGFAKNQYRTFNIKSVDLTPGDDYGMMREVLTRRFARLLRHGETAEPGAFPDTPDLVIIDGGRGQFEAAREVLSALGIEGIRLVAIAKGPDRNAGRETFFVEGREPFRLSPRDPALFFIQRLRDEAHRFAIGTHRARRKKEFVKSPLDEIPGIGPSRKRALLLAFGSAKDVAKAGLSDLEKTPGLNAATAKLVYDFFHENRAR
jgi:excinuclease UvrABC nuclease subunit